MCVCVCVLIMSQLYGFGQEGCSKWLDGGECNGQCSWTETLHDRRNPNRCDSETQANADMNEVGGGKESIKLTLIVLMWRIG